MDGGQVFGRPALRELPEVLTVEEAAAILRIGRGAAYELARRFRESGGAEGLPVVSLGRSLRVPRAALEQLLSLNGVSEQDERDDQARGRHGAA
jgi:excisionase family DNA binding protein